MDIFINGKAADITLENEEKVSDLLSGFDKWLDGSGNRLSGLVIDGEFIPADKIPEAMELNLNKLAAIDIRVSSWDELAVEAVNDLLDYCRGYKDGSFEERKSIRQRWESSAARDFLSSEINDIHDVALRSFAGEGLSPENLTLLAEERLRELSDPEAEISGSERIVAEISGRMEDLPLDVQTGKDARAAETVQLFSRVGEKLLRILQILRRRGIIQASYQIEGLSVKDFLNDFGAAIAELGAAYGNQDTVLAGDLVEYELAPRLVKLYRALKDSISVSLS